MFPGLGILLCNTLESGLPFFAQRVDPAIFSLLDLSVGETNMN